MRRLFDVRDKLFQFCISWQYIELQVCECDKAAQWNHNENQRDSQRENERTNERMKTDKQKRTSGGSGRE